MSTIYLSLGSNIEPRAKYLAKARDLLSSEVKIIKKSSIYETEPIGLKAQARFLNQVIKTQTKLKPPEVLALINKIEEQLKRVRKVKNGPRTIDIDLLFYDDLIIENPKLTVPHPRLHERAFVLVPLLEIEPEFRHKRFPKGLNQYLKATAKQSVKKCLDIWLL